MFHVKTWVLAYAQPTPAAADSCLACDMQAYDLWAHENLCTLLTLLISISKNSALTQQKVTVINMIALIWWQSRFTTNEWMRNDTTRDDDDNDNDNQLGQNW